ncbi:hypothetical protein SDC9_110255 [bioreactor metagenome]|uniref:NodB homology domain-containing protein n=1 Tax=bioreactor metagenome TaxID=1076179 RepID=A0A645BD51_9ZZZZ|nr:polysaccharide deacetylase family protein [Paludibacter sp.]
MKYKLRSIFLLLITGISIVNGFAQNLTKPSIAFSFDDGNTNDILRYKADVWNAMIVNQLKKNNIRGIWFVCGSEMDNKKGKKLLQRWNQSGNILANHTYHHWNYSDSTITTSTYINDISNCDSLIYGFKNHQKIFRCPYLEAGNTITKRDSLNEFFSHSNIKQGWITVDAFDWYFNSRLVEWLEVHPKANLDKIKDFYINNTFEKANYCHNLSLKLLGRPVKQTLLLHFNLSTALFLGDLINKFKSEGWQIENYTDAIEDSVYYTVQNTLPARQNLLWSIAKQKGEPEDVLMYLAENKNNEKEKIDKLGLFSFDKL